jgi:hypothetical protein
MDFINCPDGCGQIWSTTNGAMIDLTAVYAGGAVIAAAPAAAGVIGTTSVTAAAAAETYGIPVFTTSLWLQQNWNTLMNLRKIVMGIPQCQQNGPC